MSSQERQFKVLGTVDHVWMVMGITQKEEVGSNYVAGGWKLREASPWEGVCGCSQSAGPAPAFEGEVGTALGAIEDLMVGT